MKLYVTVFLLLGLIGCVTESNNYFVCDGYEVENYLTKTTTGFYNQESLVINKTNKSLSFKTWIMDYKEPSPQYISSQYKFTQMKDTYLLKFDIVTGELEWSTGRYIDGVVGVQIDTPVLSIEKDFRYKCKKVEKLI